MQADVPPDTLSAGRMAKKLKLSESEIPVRTVSELTALIKQTLEADFSNVCVVGETSKITQAASGHVYLTLKDENAVIRAVIWRGVASALRFDLEDGIEVLARGSVDVYPPRGSYQLIINTIEPMGMGALQLAFQQLLEKLEKEGLFRKELKKPLPPFPHRIAIVTSPTGAAIRDIVNVVFRRYPLVELYLFPTRVQGESAAEEIAHALRVLNEKRPDVDLIIVGRGGGSLEDLWAFNEEVVARAIFESAIPVVSAVGHEVDVSIADYVADVRAATPTEAGEIVVPDGQELLRQLQGHARRLALALESVVGRAAQTLRALVSRYAFRRPEAPLRERAQRLDELLGRINTACSHRIEQVKERLESVGSQLEALSPLKVLQRGYSITFSQDGRVLKTVRGLAAGDVVLSRVRDGRITSRVSEVEMLGEGSDEAGKGQQ